MSSVTSPLADIIRKAEQAGADPDSPVLRLKRRMENASQNVVVLIDVSLSMNAPGDDGVKLIALAKKAVKDLLAHDRPPILVAFGERNIVIQPSAIGSLQATDSATDLAGAFEFIAHWRPRRTIVVTDGRPESPLAVIAAADALTGSVSFLFCGTEAESKIVMPFLQKIADNTGGTARAWNLVVNPQLGAAGNPLRMLVEGS